MDLTKLSTKQLLALLERTRKFRWGYHQDDGTTVTIADIKKVLATREHVPNKAERKAARQAQAKAKKNR